MDMLQGFLEAVKPRRDGDIADRVNYCITTPLVLVFALFILSWEFCGTTIECWFPAYFKDWWSQYGKDYCYIQNTYFIPITTGPRDNFLEANDARTIIPHNITAREDKTIPYYQWLPFILVASAFSFYFPIALWRAANSSFGLWVNTILVTVNDASNESSDDQKAKLKLMSKYISVSLQAQRQNSENRFVRAWKTSNISLLYLFVKLLFVINVCCQFAMLSACLGFNKYKWGYDILVQMAMGEPWQESHYFPRVTLCDFQVRVLGNLHRHTVQCVLLINMFAEKMFVFLWWYFILVSIITIISFVHWFIAIIFIHSQHKSESFIQQFLRKIVHDDKQYDLDPDQLRMELEHFLTEELNRDGIFLLKLISTTSGDVVTLILLRNLWRRYRRKRRNQMRWRAFRDKSHDHRFPLGSRTAGRVGSPSGTNSTGDSPSGPSNPGYLPLKDEERQLIDGSQTTNPPVDDHSGSGLGKIPVPTKFTSEGLWDKEVGPGNISEMSTDSSSPDDDSDAATAAVVANSSPRPEKKKPPTCGRRGSNLPSYSSQQEANYDLDGQKRSSGGRRYRFR